MTAVRSSIRWARHSGSDKWWHAVLREDASIHTHCSGRWSVTEAFEDSANPPQEDRCAACQRAVIEVKRKEHGLVELRENMTWKPFGVLAEFDCSDVGGE